MAKILVIDDQESMRSIISQMLRDKGHQVTTADDGEQGLELFKQDTYDLVLADVNMPGIDGFELLRTVKSDHPTTPVILLTGVNEDAAQYVGKEYKADGVIKKPFQIEDTVKEIEKVISGRR